ncbi:secretory protein Sec31 [Pelomyxa schiedti]|nr:secretory protein Sec31 [Pelomyxa schiedti]
MKCKEIDRRATTAWWCPAQSTTVSPLLIAAGTVAGTIEADFDVSSSLEIFDISNPTVASVGKVEANGRFNKLVWGRAGGLPYGLLAGAMDSGLIALYNPDSILKSGSNDSEAPDPLLSSINRHQAPITALDFNSVQTNLLASASSDADIFIWDLADPSKPNMYTPGKKTNAQEVTCVAWNKKVQHILASSTYNGQASIWDLRSKKLLMSFNDHAKEGKWKSMAWHPFDATTLITASENDKVPVVQLWDLRNFHAPLKYFEGHTSGVWSVSWSSFDPNLIATAGRDKTVCWNVETAEQLCELEQSVPGVWDCKVDWSPTQPGLLSTCSLSGKVAIHTVFDPSPSVLPTPIAFGGAAVAPRSLSAPPKWMCAPCCAAFGFGGLLATYIKPLEKGAPHNITIQRLESDAEFVKRAVALEDALASASLTAFCEEKVKASTDEIEQHTWEFLQLALEKESRRETFLQHLGFKRENLKEEIRKIIASMKEKTTPPSVTPSDEKKPVEKPQEEVPATPASTETTEPQDVSSTDCANLFGNTAPEEGAVFDSIAATAPPQTRSPPPSSDSATVTSSASTTSITEPSPVHLPINAESVIAQAILLGDFETAVTYCMETGQPADALILASKFSNELFIRTRDEYVRRNWVNTPSQRMLKCLVNTDLFEIVHSFDLSQWKSALALLCTYAKPDQFAVLCSLLGDRLKQEQKDSGSSVLCYILAGNFEKAVLVWVEQEKQKTLDSLQSFMEKTVIFRKLTGVEDSNVSEALATKFAEYASVLAAQGKSSIALRYLSYLRGSATRHPLAQTLIERLDAHQEPQKTSKSETPGRSQKIEAHTTAHPQQVPPQKPKTFSTPPLTPPFTAPNKTFTTPVQSTPLPPVTQSPQSQFGVSHPPVFPPVNATIPPVITPPPVFNTLSGSKPIQTLTPVLQPKPVLTQSTTQTLTSPLTVRPPPPAAPQPPPTPPVVLHSQVSNMPSPQGLSSQTTQARPYPITTSPSTTILPPPSNTHHTSKPSGTAGYQRRFV